MFINVNSSSYREKMKMISPLINETKMSKQQNVKLDVITQRNSNPNESFVNHFKWNWNLANLKKD